MNLNSNTITKFDKQSFDTLSLQVAEIQSVLAFLSTSDGMENKEALTVSVLERLATWLQADILAYQQAYVEQIKQADTAPALKSVTEIKGGDL